MTADELFLLTLEDLDARVPLGQGEYDALMTAWLLRKLLLDEHPMITEANKSRGCKIRYKVVDNEPPPGIAGWHPNEFIYPGNWTGAPTVDLNHDEFLARTVLVASGETVTVRELVKFMANVEGAVHFRGPDGPKEEALWDFRWGTTISGPGGQYSGGIHTLTAIGRVVLDAVRDLRERVQTEAWPPGFPASARGLKRVRDPRTRGS